MKYLKTFENETERNYVIISNIDGRLAISVKFKKSHKFVTSYPFQFIDSFFHDNFTIKYYTKEEAFYDLTQIENYYNTEKETHDFEVISKNELEIMINANKYNL
jgi:hypothetical protein